MTAWTAAYNHPFKSSNLNISPFCPLMLYALSIASMTLAMASAYQRSKKSKYYICLKKHDFYCVKVNTFQIIKIHQKPVLSFQRVLYSQPPQLFSEKNLILKISVFIFPKNEEINKNTFVFFSLIFVNYSCCFFFKDKQI